MAHQTKTARKTESNADVLKESVSLIDLAISRCRARKFAAEELEDSIRKILEETRQELLCLEETIEPATDRWRNHREPIIKPGRDHRESKI